MKNQDLQKTADELFAIHDLKELYLTSDGQGFKEKQRAEMHGQNLSNKDVHYFKRQAEAKSKEEDKTKGLQREELVVQYKRLFGVKPNHNIGTDKLKIKVAEKQAEISKIEAEAVTVTEEEQPETNH